MVTQRQLDWVVRALTERRYGHLERRTCTAEAPMQEADKDKYRWGHPDAVQTGTFFNLNTYTCPHCGLSFNAQPPQPKED